MKTRLGKVICSIIIATILSNPIWISLPVAHSSSSEVNLDLFTQQRLNNGTGHDVPSDAYGPGEIVILYALITHAGIPLQNQLVTFQITIPDNSSFALTANANSAGIAAINFTIPNPSSFEDTSDLFGTWLVLANTQVQNVTYQDTLTFKVGWIVELLGLRTIDEDRNFVTEFGIGGDLGIELTLRSISKIVRDSTIALVIIDELGFPINHTEIIDFKVAPDERVVVAFFSLDIPLYAAIGNGTLHASVLTDTVDAGGVPYSPPITSAFKIVSVNPITVAFHDIAIVEVSPSASSVQIGEPLNIRVLVQNEGTETEAFSVASSLGSQTVENPELIYLLSHTGMTINFTFDTVQIGLGNFTTSASISILPAEADVSDNALNDGTVQIQSQSPSNVHDLAITSIVISSTLAFIGDGVQINVTVWNKGTETEDFGVNAYYDSLLLGTMQVNSIEPRSVAVVTFMWDTGSIPENFYQISAFASLPTDINPSDNTFIDGIILVKTRPPASHDVAVLSVVPSQSFAYIGQIIDINATVANTGDYMETFNVYVRYNETILSTTSVANLTARSTYSFIVQWDTTGVSIGNYTVIAFAEPVPEEMNIQDNTFTDGIVQIVRSSGSLLNFPWYGWLILLLAALMVFLAVVWAYTKRKAKRNQETFETAWMQWYYHSNPNGKSTALSKNPKKHAGRRPGSSRVKNKIP